MTFLDTADTADTADTDDLDAAVPRGAVVGARYGDMSHIDA